MGATVVAKVKNRMTSSDAHPITGDVWWVADVLVVVVESPSTKLFSSTNVRDQVRCFVVEDLDEVFSPAELVHFDLEDFRDDVNCVMNQRYPNTLQHTRRLMP